MNHLLVAENITKSFGDKTALNNFSLEIPKGSIYGLLGPNGAGKTTFIRIVNQITMPDSGNIYIKGEKLNPKHIAYIGYMPEERGLYKNMKVGEQAIYLAQLKGLSAHEAQIQLKKWFDKLDIGNWWNKKLSELSKGMGQKIQFIVTVLHQPELLIFDEPFSGFDPVNANMIRDEIIELKNNGATIIFSTHRMESVEEMCDHVALIDNANKILDGSIQEIRNKFKENIYQVQIKLNHDKEAEFKTFIEKSESINLETNHGITSFNLKHKSLNNNDLIMELTKYGQLHSFSEVIPNMNQIFINAVK